MFSLLIFNNWGSWLLVSLLYTKLLAVFYSRSMVIDRNPNDQLVVVKFFRKCIIRLLQVHCKLQEMFFVIWKYRKVQSWRFCTLFCRCILIDHLDVITWRWATAYRHCKLFSHLMSRLPLLILWTDESHFSLTRKVNPKNCILWVDKKYPNVAPMPLHKAKVTVYCGIASTFVLGSYFFEQVTSTGMKTRSITRPWYTAILQNYVISELQ